MVWYNLQIGKYNLKYMPLKTKTQNYPYCDKDGNLLNRVMPVYSEKGYFLDDKGKKVLNAFRLINGKPFAKLSKTKEVNAFKEVNDKEVNDLISEKEYICDSEFLLEDLKDSGKALKFGFTNGNGFKVFIAYIYVDKLYNMLFMKLGTTLKSEVMKDIKEIMANKKKAKDLQITIDGVDKARVEDLIQI